jgi:hypothetical protein
MNVCNWFVIFFLEFIKGQSGMARCYRVFRRKNATHFTEYLPFRVHLWFRNTLQQDLTEGLTFFTFLQVS